ncbi:MAG: M28 family peptidase [Saprospiraceae bacterium]|nr:MAG: M28 family peptidase [Saprospiraceae bacterium]
MKKTFTTLLLFNLLFIAVYGQTNMLSTNPVAEEVMLGNYDPASYMPTTVLNHPDEIIQGILAGVSPDSLKKYLFDMSAFHTRNTGSDTISAVSGIGAARRWVYQKFQQISAGNENRLIPSYLQFDQTICSVGQHRNVFAVLPGIDTSLHDIIIIEAHLDSRCSTVCDTACLAEGMEDNGSGSALVLELARVMSQFAFDRTIVFMTTIGEEQGLYGAGSFAKYAKNKGIAIRAVLNNDIVGGIICGETSSPPSCPGLNEIDSTQVRLFSAGSINSPNKQLARFIKLEYAEELQNLVTVPMLLTIMSAEDRSGRGGDHIPFRQEGFPAMRFTSANEHGNANTSDPNYHDRQHTSGDVLGVDTDANIILDSFFVDFNYLSRNAVINGVAAALAAIGPVTPGMQATKFEDSITVHINDPYNYGEYRIFLRSTSTHDFLEIFTVSDTVATVPKPETGVVVSVASVDENGIESLFTGEVIPPTVTSSGEVKEAFPEKVFELFQNRPNPFDEATIIDFQVFKPVSYKEAYIAITDLQGKEIQRLKTALKMGLNEVLYTHGYHMTGVFAYSLVVDGEVVATKRIVFAN